MRKSPFPNILFAFTVLSGCCLGVHCDCVPDGAEVRLQASSPWCESIGPNAIVKWDATYAQSGVPDNRMDCGFLSFTDNLPVHFIFLQDTVAVDTLTLQSATYKERGKKACCSCGPAIESLTYTFKGKQQTVQGNVISLPL